MRVLILSSIDIDENILRKNNDIEKFVHIDITKDIEEAEYLAYIRRYNQIYLEFNESNYKLYYNLFKVLNQYEKDFSYQLKILITEKTSKNILDIFKTHTKKIYKNISPEFISVEPNELKSFFKESILEGFYRTPEVIEKYEIDIKNQKITLIIDSKEFNVHIKSKKDFKVLVFFIQHYGEVLNIDTIVSATSSKPELSSISPIESAISSIRNIFKKHNLFPGSPIVSIKRIGYKFALN